MLVFYSVDILVPYLVLMLVFCLATMSHVWLPLLYYHACRFHSAQAKADTKTLLNERIKGKPDHT